MRKELEEDFKARMAESQQEIEDMKRSWQEKLLQAQASGVRKQLTTFLSTKLVKY